DVQSSCLMQHDPHYYIGLHNYVSWIFRVDHNGELLWERIAGNSNNLNTGTYPCDVIKQNDKENTVASKMTYYEPGWETYDINCPYNANMPGSGINFWVYHITDIFDYDDVGEIEDNENAVSLEIHPNPTQNTVNITFSDDTDCQSVEIYALDGSLLKSQISNLETVDVSKLNAGIYILKVNMADGREFTERIVKE
ncbi:MAG: T9SS type A sorting domain-containing protein, partial [Bacteroidales bacterium]|nr:T9SS type A sorting domain-containing protein [Bacteroidales bacterium]